MNVSALNNVKELLGGEKFPKCESMSLRLEKFVRLGDHTKKEEIDAVVSKSQERISFVVPKGAVTFTAKLGGRLIINQSGGVLENAGLCIYPHFNTPYIPGSAVKGCARHAAWQAWDETEDENTKIALAKEIVEIFGYPTGDKALDKFLAEKSDYKNAQAGKVVFLDAVPETTAPLVTDIVNCHHKDYYAGKKPYATDDESPIPNFFPAVEAGAKFIFAIAPMRGVCSDELLLKAKGWVIKAITVNGVGAKTSAGYGWFEYDEQAEMAREEQRRKIEEAGKLKKQREDEERRRVQEESERRARREAMSVLEIWEERGAASICGPNGREFEKCFSNSGESKKDEIVKALQQENGIGANVWQMLRTDKKRKNQNAVSTVSKWARERKLGRMPQ